MGSLEEALNLVRDQDEVFIGGGESLYREALPIADQIYLTTIHFEVEGDTFFPELGAEFRKIESTNVAGEPSFTYQTFVRT